MDPSVEEAKIKRDQAAAIEVTAGDLRSDGNSNTAIGLETTAQDLRNEADQEEAEAAARAEEEKEEVNEKFGTG